MHSSSGAKRPSNPSCERFGALGTVVVWLPGVSPFDCRVGVRPGISLTRRKLEGHGGPRRKDAASSDEAPQAILEAERAEF